MDSLIYETRPLGFNIRVDESIEEVKIMSEAKLKCLLKCSFSLSEEEAQVLTYLILRGRGEIPKDIARAIGRNPEVVRRALRELYRRGLVTRRPYPLRRGGRAYLYEVPRELVDAFTDVCIRLGMTLKNFTKNE